MLEHEHMIFKFIGMWGEVSQTNYLSWLILSLQDCPVIKRGLISNLLYGMRFALEMHMCHTVMRLDVCRADNLQGFSSASRRKLRKKQLDFNDYWKAER